ncbi:MAG: OB-fold domain-containing protein [Syntrophomonadaceae bacterium]|jgi:hydroxymethylglutaryl-CoA synthase
MVGITGFGAYVPYNRLNRSHIKETFGAPVPKGEKAVANYDEDSITMAAMAALDCTANLDTKTIDAVYFATTTAPYKEKQSATTIAGVLDTRMDIRTADFCDSLRAGSTAILAGLDAAKQGLNVLVATGECRLGYSAGSYENHFGDGAAALSLGNQQVIAEYIDSCSIAVDFHDLWRADNERFVHSWEERFCITQGYNQFVSDSVKGVLKKTGLTPKDFSKIVLYGVTPRYQGQIAAKLGFAPAQIQDSLYNEVGNTGTANVPMMLVGALEEAKPGDYILLVSYSEGSDAIVFKATDEIAGFSPGLGLKGYIENKKVSMNYGKYLRWRELIATEPAKRPVQKRSSLPDMYRNRKKNLGFYGVRCKNCGTVQFPPSRICIECRSIDKMEDYRLYGKQARVATFTIDYLAESLDPPTIVAVVDFEGGGRLICYLVDCDPSEVKVGMEVKMSFRHIFTVDSIRTYFWKAVPKL